MIKRNLLITKHLNMIKLKHNKPQIYDRLKKHFNIDWDNGIIITYGNNVYCKYEIPFHLEIHEEVHIKQQNAYGPEQWWDRYISDPQFRLEQEREAYLKQAIWVKANIKDRNEKYRILNKIVLDFSSGIYGNIITREEASKLIK